MEYLTTKDVVGELGITRARVVYHIRAGHLRAVEKGGIYLIHPKDLEEFKNNRRQAGRPKVRQAN